MDLYSDWVEIMRTGLTNLGYDVSATDDRAICHVYQNLFKRTVLPAHRKIYYSDIFSCPAHLQKNIKHVENLIVNNKIVAPHLSKNLKDINYNDPLLNDWGIHHLHLGMSIKSDGFSERTGELLFAIFDDGNCYAINILQHGVWTKSEFVETIHRNWPHLISDYRIKNAISLANDVSDTDRKILRKKHANAFVETQDGTIYAPIGGGISASGMNVEIVMRCDKFTWLINAWEDTVSKHFDDFVKEMNDNQIPVKFPVVFKLGFSDTTGIGYVIPQGYDFQFKMGHLQ